MRESGNPRSLEFQTIVSRALMYDPDLYRDKAEVTEKQKRDPILIFEQHMREQGFNPDEIRPQVEASVKAEIDDAVKFAEESPVEEISDLLKDVTTPVGVGS
ncbi:MAG: thiamine pyrophosphate-dependent enzyme [Turneriella sp.]